MAGSVSEKTFVDVNGSPMFEEPERTRRILPTDVMHGVAMLADPG
jgi:hypothetical protein